MLQVIIQHPTSAAAPKRGEAGAPRKRLPQSQLVSPFKMGASEAGSIFLGEYFWQRLARLVSWISKS